MLCFLSAEIPKWFTRRVQSLQERSSKRRDPDLASKMISIEEARAGCSRKRVHLPVESRALADALGMVLGEEIVAPHSVPPFDNSGMDGFAVRAADTVDATAGPPVLLDRRRDHSGRPRRHTSRRADEAAKIMTGAPMPGGGGRGR